MNRTMAITLLALIIALLLAGCANTHLLPACRRWYYEPKTVYSLPPGFVALNEVMISEEVRFWSFHIDLINCMTLKDEHLYSMFTRDAKFIVKYKGKYYINENKHRELVSTSGFLLLDEIISYWKKTLSYDVLANDQIVFFGPNGNVIYQTDVNDSDFIINYEGRYYIELDKFNELIKLASIIKP